MTHTRVERDQRVPNLLHHYRGSLLIQTIIVTVGLATHGQTPSQHAGTLGTFGLDWQLLTQGHVWQVLTGTWLQSSPGISASMMFMVAAGTVPLEHIIGTKRMLVTVIPTDWMSTVLTCATLWILSGIGYERFTPLLTTPDAGSSALAHAGFGATATLLPGRWRWIALMVLATYTVAQMFHQTPAPAIAHAWACVIGAFIAHHWNRDE